MVDVDNFVSHSIDAGLRQFWGMWNWTFKEAEYKLTISEGKDSYDLPSDFEAIKTITEKSTNQGAKLIYMPKEEFDRMIPRQATFQSNTPQAFTIFGNSPTSSRKKISFFPQPTSDTLYLLYLKTTPTEPDVIPDKFQCGAEAFMTVRMYQHGKQARRDAYIEAREEFKRLVQTDKYDQSNPTKYMDETDVVLYSNPPYYAT